MGGDHKCPVCQATFTRPQHVARHMRSHTGDRPYKCQYCGDQFARSDLLSRHVNKCHAGEAPMTGSGTRGKGAGRTTATRATTSKQACDQCVQSSLPCDGANPCGKCIHRKCRCTFVKFHRQTAPVGPGHNPTATHHSSTAASSLSSSNVPSLYSSSSHSLGGQPADGFLMGATHSTSGHSFPSQGYTYSSSAAAPNSTSFYSDLGAIEGSAEYALKYRTSQAELLRRGPSGPVGNPPPGSFAGDWPAWQQPLQHPTTSAPHLVPYSANGADAYMGRTMYTLDDSNGYDSRPSTGHGRKGSADFEYDYSESDGSSTRDGSLPSSATSSSLHLPLAGQPGYRDSYNDQRGEGGFDSAFGLLSLEDPNVLAGISEGTPFFAHEPPQPAQPVFAYDPLTSTSASNNRNPLLALDLQSPSGSHILSSRQQRHGSHNMEQTRPSTAHAMSTPGGSGNRETETKELRDFWKQYMRTPLTGPNSLFTPTPGGQSQGLSQSHPAQSPSTGASHSHGSGRPRGNSLPSAKTPSVYTDLQEFMAHPTQYSSHSADSADPAGGKTGMHNPDDLRSYEAAVLARKAPVTLSLAPKMRRGNLPGPSQHPAAPGSDMQQTQHYHHQQQQQQQQQQPMSLAQRRGSLRMLSTSGGPGSSSLSGALDESPQPSPIVQDQSMIDMTSRPTFKRLPSQVLEPEYSKHQKVSLSRSVPGFEQVAERNGEWGHGDASPHAGVVTSG